ATSPRFIARSLDLYKPNVSRVHIHQGRIHLPARSILDCAFHLSLLSNVQPDAIGAAALCFLVVDVDLKSIELRHWFAWYLLACHAGELRLVTLRSSLLS